MYTNLLKLYKLSKKKRDHWHIAEKSRGFYVKQERKADVIRNDRIYHRREEAYLCQFIQFNILRTTNWEFKKSFLHNALINTTNSMTS